MKKKIKYCFLAVIFSLTSCSVVPSFNDRPVREAIDVPDHFVTKSGEDFDENSCKSPLVDPRTKVEIIMVESLEGNGDYRVPSGSYGVEANEVLRIDCKTGKVIGIVRNR